MKNHTVFHIYRYYSIKRRGVYFKLYFLLSLAKITINHLLLLSTHTFVSMLNGVLSRFYAETADMQRIQVIFSCSPQLVMTALFELCEAFTRLEDSTCNRAIFAQMC